MDPDVAVQLANKIYDTGQIPTLMHLSTVAIQAKRRGTMEGNNFKAVSIMKMKMK